MFFLRMKLCMFVYLGCGGWFRIMVVFFVVVFVSWILLVIWC